MQQYCAVRAAPDVQPSINAQPLSGASRPPPQRMDIESGLIDEDEAKFWKTYGCHTCGDPWKEKTPPWDHHDCAP
jgi:hypothetical protein